MAILDLPDPDPLSPRPKQRPNELDIRPTEIRGEPASFSSRDLSPVPLHTLIEAMPGRVALLNRYAEVLALNAAWRNAAAELPEDPFAPVVIGSNYLALCKSVEGRCDGVQALQADVSDLQRGATSQFSRTYWLQLGKAKRHFLATGAPAPGRPDLIIVTHSDITAALASTRRRRAPRTQQAIVDAERRRIARELHDNTQHQLMAAKFGLQDLMRLADDPRFDDTIAIVSTALSTVQHEIRTLSYLLHPPELTAGGLSTALQGFAAGFARRTGLVIQFVDRSLPAKVPNGVENAIYRMAQEALSNIHRHAGAQRVSMILASTPSQLTLEVEDDGVGMAESLIAGHDAEQLGVGLKGMRERLRIFSGWLEIERLKPGTLLRATVPLPAQG